MSFIIWEVNKLNSCSALFQAKNLLTYPFTLNSFELHCFEQCSDFGGPKKSIVQGANEELYYYYSLFNTDVVGLK